MPFDNSQEIVIVSLASFFTGKLIKGAIDIITIFQLPIIIY